VIAEVPVSGGGGAPESRGAVSERKRALRDAMRARRLAVVPEQAARAGERAAARLGEELARIARVPSLALLYAPLAGELDTGAIDSLLRARGVRVAYPRLTAPGELALHLALPSSLHPGAHRIPEPPPGAPEIDPAAVELALLPGLAFDRAGNRLGFGQGCFDRLLPRCAGAVRIGACLDGQLVDAVPAEAHDARMDFVLCASGDGGGAPPCALIATHARALPSGFRAPHDPKETR